MGVQVFLAKNENIPQLLPALIELRTNRTEQELEQMLRVQLEQNFQIAFIGDEKMAYSILSFRMMNMLHSGKILYIDDLVTHSKYRKKGYAKILLEWIEEYAKSVQCETLSLDSGFQRKDAYRLYLNFGFEISSMHFSKKLL